MPFVPPSFILPLPPSFLPTPRPPKWAIYRSARPTSPYCTVYGMVGGWLVNCVGKKKKAVAAFASYSIRSSTRMKEGGRGGSFVGGGQ